MEEELRKGFPGVLVDGVFWYWDGDVSTTAIGERKAIATLRKIQMIAALVVATMSFALFAFGVFAYHATEALDPEFWLEPNIFLFGFWMGLLSLCYVGYRKTVGKDDMRLLPRPKNGAPERTAVPGIDAVSERRGIFATCDEGAVSALEDAFSLAKSAGHAEVTSLHIFAAATNDSDTRVLFARLGLTFDVLRDPLRRKMATLVPGQTAFGSSGMDIVLRAFELSLAERRRRLTTVELLAAAYEVDEFLQEVLYANNVDRETFMNALAWLRIGDELHERYLEFRKAASLKPTSNMNRAYTAIATPFLDSVSEDLTKAAVYGHTGMLVGRDSEMENILRAIEGGNQSVVLVGNPGVGKAAIIDGMAERMVEERVPDILKDKRLLKLSVPHIVSTQGGTGAEERFLVALNEVGMSGNIVLVIENIHELVGRGSGVDLSSILSTELERGYTFVVATTTPQAYAELVERSILGPKLQRIAINEPERNDAIHVLESHVGAIEHKHNIAFTYQALAACVDLSMRYMHDGALPEKAIEVAREVALEVSKRPKAGTMSWVKKEDVATLISARTQIPVTDVAQEEGQKLLQLEKRLHERVIGQEAAITAVASALRRARTELRSSNRPIANFLFLGPTGVGKTELAKATSEVFFGNENAMVRFDMSEYQDQASVARLIGGNGQAGLLTEAIRRAPFSLLLLDELEKAHPEILNLFLQVMDDGRLTDGLGRTIDFTNVILIATSNAGTQYIQDEVAKGSSLEIVKTGLMETELRQHYRPEFLNRFDDVIVFTPLTKDDVAAIAYLMVAKIVERLKAKGLSFSVTDAAIHELAEAGYDPKFGARPLRRVMQERVENAIAEKLLGGGVTRRDALVYDVGGKLDVVKAQQL